MTCQPAAMKRRAAARPKPAVAPVMRAVRGVVSIPAFYCRGRGPQWVLTAIAGRPPPASLALASASSRGAAVRPHAHPVDGLAVDLRGLHACVEAEQRDLGLGGLGIAGGAEGAGLQDVARVAAAPCGQPPRLAVVAGADAVVVAAAGVSPSGAGSGVRGAGRGRRPAAALRPAWRLACASALGLRAGRQLGVGHRHFLARQQRVEVVLGRLGLVRVAACGCASRVAVVRRDRLAVVADRGRQGVGIGLRAGRSRRCRRT